MEAVSDLRPYELFDDFVEFSKKHLYSGDIDPVYPVLRNVHRFRGLSREDAAWHTYLYLTWYHLGSSEKVYQANPHQELINEEFILPTGVERRGFRGTNKGVEQLNWITNNIGPILPWVEKHCASGGMSGWESMYEAVQAIPQNGTWAAFKWCDLCKYVLGFNITSPDIGLGGKGEKAGPVAGLSLLTSVPRKEVAKDIKLQESVYQSCLNAGVPFRGLEEFETALCDFNSAYKGGYYVGHDLDKQMEDLKGLPSEYWRSRKKSFPPEYLGEMNDWFGVRKDLKKRMRREIDERKTTQAIGTHP